MLISRRTDIVGDRKLDKDRDLTIVAISIGAVAGQNLYLILGLTFRTGDNRI
jgi:hypothetical protein